MKFEILRVYTMPAGLLTSTAQRSQTVLAVQATFSFLVGFIVCKSTCGKSFVYASHFLMEAYGWFGTAYFMYDIWSMYKVHTQEIANKLKLMRVNTASKLRSAQSMSHTNGDGTANSKKFLVGSNSATSKQEENIYDYDGESVQIPKDGKWDFIKYVVTDPIMMIYQVFIGTFGLLVVTYIRGGGHFIYSYMFMMELSTPFVSIRSILSTMHLKATSVDIVNGLLMLATFLVFRVCMWPYVIYRYSIAIDATFWEALTGFPRGCFVSIMILFLPQIYWFFLMVKGALKVLFPSKKDTNESNSITSKQLSNKSKNNNLSPVTPKDEHAFYQHDHFPGNHTGNNGNNFHPGYEREELSNVENTWNLRGLKLECSVVLWCVQKFDNWKCTNA